MKGLNHGLEFIDGIGRKVARLERKKSDGIVTPIIAEPAVHKLTVVDKTVHRHELDRCHSQAGEEFNHRGGCQPRVCSPQVGGDIGVAHRESLDMEFINQSLMPGNFRRGIASPGESGVDYPILRHTRGIVAAVKRQILLLMSDLVSKVRIRPMEGALNLLAVGIKEKFMRIKTKASLRSIRPINPVPV